MKEATSRDKFWKYVMFLKRLHRCWWWRLEIKCVVKIFIEFGTKKNFRSPIWNIGHQHHILPCWNVTNMRKMSPTNLFCHQYNDGIDINVTDFDFPRKQNSLKFRNSKIQNFKLQRGYLVILFCISEVVYFRWLMLTRSN